MSLPIDEHAAAAIRPLLKPGETILWAGRPRQGIVFQINDWFNGPVVLTGALLLGFTIFQAFGLAPRWHAPKANNIPFTAFYLAFTLCLVLVRLIVDRHFRAQTTYAVTDWRVAIARNNQAPSNQTASLRSWPIQPAELAMHRNGHGTITFGGPYWLAGSFNPPMPFVERIKLHPIFGRSRMFYQIDNAEAVYSLITNPDTVKTA
jgi:hypothetical protein